MEIGIFAKTFARPTLAATLDAVVSHGLHCVQFNLACAGLPSLPDRFDSADGIRRELEMRKITMVAVSGTFNLIHPDPAKRRDGLNRLRVLAASCRQLGTSVITLCTGTRDPENMWRRHPENDTPQAWRDLIVSINEAISIASEHDITLAFEPEVSNVVDSARKGRRLLDEIGSPRLQVVMDAANLFHAGELPRMREILDEAFELLGRDIILAHAKDLNRDGDAGHGAAGTGLLDYDYYISRLKNVGFTGPLILHSLAENQVDDAVQFLKKKLAQRSAGFQPAVSPTSSRQGADHTRGPQIGNLRNSRLEVCATAPFFQRGGLNFHYLDVGQGVPFVFQHGLGGDVNQPAGLFRPPPGIRLIAFDCRAHGETRPLGDPGKLSFNSFTEDLLALLDHLGVERAVVGGISMGAGVALNFTLRYPARVMGLVLSRPAWLDQPFPEQLHVYPRMAVLIRQHGAKTGLALFRESTDFADSLVGQFTNPRAEDAVERLERLPRDAPNRDWREWATIRVPTLVLGNRQDVIHPFDYAQTLAQAIPGATLRELTPKSMNEQQHAADTQKFLNEFFHERIMTC